MPISTKKQRRNVRRAERVYWDCESLSTILQEVKDALESYGEDAYLDVSEGSYSTAPVLEICYSSEETDKEYESRVLMGERQKKHRAQQYEKLKKEFEG